MLLLNLDRAAATPMYMQIVRQVRRLVESDTLKTGAKLPSSRALAEKLGVDRTTVYQAYQELWALGYVDSRPGSYTRVRARVQVARPQDRAKTPAVDWARAANPASERIYTRLLSARPENPAATTPDFINLSRLDMDGRIFPVDAFRRALARVMARSGGELLHYGNHLGYPPLREYIAERARSHGMDVSADEVLITNGSQQAIDLVFRLLALPGQPVAIETPTYSHVLPLLTLHGCAAAGVPMRDDGLDLNHLRGVLERNRPAFLYTIPNFQNPTGVTTSQAHRERLLALCEEHRLPLVEDGFEEEMKYFGKVSLPIKSMDRHGVVIYLGTFSKVLFPGVRVGWIIAERECIRRLMAIKRFTDISSSGPVQAALHEFCRQEHFDLHIRRMHRVFRRRMQVALEAMRKHLPARRVAWSKPTGGYLIWVRFRAGVDEDRFHRLCAEHRLSVAPGGYFFPEANPDVYFRISISMLDEAEIRAGIEQLGRALRALGK